MIPYRSVSVVPPPRACTFVGKLPWIPTALAALFLLVAIVVVPYRNDGITCERHGASGQCEARGKTFAVEDVLGLDLDSHETLVPKLDNRLRSTGEEIVSVSRLVLLTRTGTVPLEVGYSSSSSMDGRPALVGRFDTFLRSDAPSFPGLRYHLHTAAGVLFFLAIAAATVLYARGQRELTRLEIEPAEGAILVTRGRMSAPGSASRFALSPDSAFTTHTDGAGQWLVLVQGGSSLTPLAKLPKNAAERDVWIARANEVLARTAPP